MEETQGGAPSPDDTAAFQRFYAESPPGQSQPDHGMLYKVFIGWWRDRLTSR